LKATGAQRDLFGMEDLIAHQVKRALPQPVVADAGPEMLKQPVPPPAVEPSGPVVMGPDQARQLEEQIERAVDRVRYSPFYGADPYYYSSGYYSPFYYYYPAYGYGYHRHYRPNWGHHHSGGFHGNVGGVGGGATVSDGRNYGIPTGNYMNFGRMTMGSAGRVNVRH
jgi:hypothetical protein